MSVSSFVGSAIVDNEQKCWRCVSVLTGAGVSDNQWHVWSCLESGADMKRYLPSDSVHHLPSTQIKLKDVHCCIDKTIRGTNASALAT